MRWLLSLFLFGFLAVVQAASSSGSKLLVVLEELADKSKYSKYLGDLEGTAALFAFVLGSDADVLNCSPRLQDHLRIPEEREDWDLRTGRESL